MITSLLLVLAAPQGVPGDTVLFEHTHRLTSLGKTVQEVRHLDSTTGTIQVTYFDENRQVVDGLELRRKDKALAIQASGKISPELWEQMGAADNNEPLHVVFWLRAEDSPDFRMILRDAEAAGMDGETARRYARDAAVQFFAERNAAFAERLQMADIEVTQVTGPWPLVFALVPPDQIAPWAADSAVDMAYFSFPTWMPELDDAANTMRTHVVWDRGITGAGSAVKTMVNDTADVVSNNPYLPPIIYITQIGVGSHATSVAGNIAMDHPNGLQAAAKGLPELYSGGGSGDSNAPNVWNSAITFGVSFGNCSWWNGNKGQIVFLDRFFDYTLRNFAMMMFKSTGNQGNTGSPYTTTPGNGYNSTNSGAYNDDDSIEWDDDNMASYSSYWDPIEGHEKPELANCGDDVDTADTSSPWIDFGFGGTSSASPLTCGVATLLATRDNSLMTQPETIKAVLMASAWHNVEGNDVLSEFDGAGAVHAAAADAVVRDSQFVNGVLTNGSFSGGNFDIPFTAYAGDETRVCALWFSNANSSHTTDVLEMDLDMVILNPSNQTVASSANGFNPFEILKFTPASTGTYTIRLQNQRFDGTSEPYAVAWSSRQDAAEGQISITGSTSIGSTFTVEWKQRYDGSAFYQAHGSNGTLPDTADLGGGYVLPLRQDGLFNSSANRPGASGNLNSSGTATAAVTLPNNGNLVGRVIYMAFYTKDNSATTAINSTSELSSFTILP